MKNYIILILCILSFYVGHIQAQTAPSAYVDKNGILRWTADKSEVTEFGINYAIPFQHAFWANKQLNIPHQKTVDEDVYHFTRLGLKAYRIHIWDSEISDTVGNLLQNEHLRIFDYTVYKMKERGFKFLLTPIAFWPGVPDEGKELPGFSAKYGKENSYSNPDAILAAENYLRQFMNHVNPYTGLAYKDDPDIIGFEISNEPTHPNQAPEDAIIYVNRLVKAIRDSGCRKPLFYCLSIATQLLDAFLETDIDGGSSMWYPNGLGAGFTCKNNQLTMANQWPRDFVTDAARAKKKALIAYEMDATDHINAYTYPLMARVLRTKGFQFAAQFAYDPISIASFNSDWDTHYVNLAYTPQKAISLKIAGEVFRRIPRLKEYGEFPADTIFDVFRLSHPENLSEMITDEKYIYSNSTLSAPPNAAKLKEIAGYGVSPVINYSGRGAYFLDKLSNGIWRLEVMPDATIVQDPFNTPNPLNKVISAITWTTWPMIIDLPDLGNDFSMQGVNKGNIERQIASGKEITVTPGTYLLVRKGVANKWKATDTWKDIIIGEFVAPEPTQGTYLVHQPVSEIVTGKPYTIKADVVSSEQPMKVLFNLSKLKRWSRPIEMKQASRYEYTAVIPEEMLKEEGILTYQITVQMKGEPSPGIGKQMDAHPVKTPTYTMSVTSPTSPICLLDVTTDHHQIRKPHYSSRLEFLPSTIPGKYSMKMDEKKIHYMSYYFKDKNAVHLQESGLHNKLVVKGRAISNTPVTIWIILQTLNGLEYGAPVTFTADKTSYDIPLKEFKRVRVVGGLAEWGNPTNIEIVPQMNEKLDIRQVETIKLNVVPTQKDLLPAAVIEYINLEV